MSLDFSYANVVNKDEVMTNPAYPKDWHPIGNALVWMSLVCGYRDITEANAVKIAQRVMEYQSIKGPLLEYMAPGADGKTEKRSLYIDLPEVKRYIGLKTNGSVMTDREWNKHLLSIVSGDAADIRWRKREEPSALEQFTVDCVAINARKAKEGAA